VRHPRRPVAGTRSDAGHGNTGRAFPRVARGEVRRGRVVRRIREERFLGRDEVAQVRLHRRDVRLRLGVGELRNRDRGQDADDHDHDEELDEREALAGIERVEHEQVLKRWGCGEGRPRPNWGRALIPP